MKAAAVFGFLVTVAVSLSACGNFPQTSLRATGVKTGNACLDSLNQTCIQIFSPVTCTSGAFQAAGPNDCMGQYAVRKAACEAGMSAEQVSQMQITCN